MSKSVVITAMCAPYEGDCEEVWAVNRAFTVTDKSRITRLYFFDRDDDFEQGFIDEVNAVGATVYTRKKRDDIKRSRAYPLDEITKHFGLTYFPCTIAYMIAHAIYEGYTYIGLNGMYHPTDSWEYMIHKAPVEFWTGMAIGNGCHVETLGDTSLCKPLIWESEKYGYIHNRNAGIAINTMRIAYEHCYETMLRTKRYCELHLMAAHKACDVYPVAFKTAEGERVIPQRYREKFEAQLIAQGA